ncbi:hypothetical protein [Paenibacillus sp. Marseille-Q4541]|uniref:hypothetical protein n=1 Tax=Paenibacillus sp. Marseille-Q4541 TaxID=2831522 RepID=UPI001BAAB04A|nr:hypothetical protein [Paenibacillus sp. Marseille-Q4541]
MKFIYFTKVISGERCAYPKSEVVAFEDSEIETEEGKKTVKHKCVIIYLGSKANWIKVSEDFETILEIMNEDN